MSGTTSNTASGPLEHVNSILLIEFNMTVYSIRLIWDLFVV